MVKASELRDPSRNPPEQATQAQNAAEIRPNPAEKPQERCDHPPKTIRPMPPRRTPQIKHRVHSHATPLARAEIIASLPKIGQGRLLRCIEVNGDWEDFMESSQADRSAKLRPGAVLQIRSRVPTQLPVAA